MKLPTPKFDSASRRAASARNIVRRCGLRGVALTPAMQDTVEKLTTIKLDSDEGRKLLKKLPLTHDIVMLLSAAERGDHASA